MQFIKETAEILSDFNLYSAIFRILLSALIGGCIGSERGRHGRAAGLRTHILVCLGATMTMLVGFYSVCVLGVSSDPMRVGAQVISGIGFLGAGTILTHNRSQITGLTTAAGLWTTASIGLAIGVGFYWAAIIAFVVVLITVTILSHLERTQKNPNAKVYYLELNDICHVNALLGLMEGAAVDIQMTPPRSGYTNHVGLICTFVSGEQAEDILTPFYTLPYIPVIMRLSE